MQAQVQVGRCSLSNKGGGSVCRRSSKSMGNGRMRTACGTWKIPWNTRCATRLVCVYTHKCQCLSAFWVLQYIVLVIMSVFSAARVTVAHTVRHSRCVLRKRGWLGSWAWEGLELKKKMVAHRP